ncbi:MAG: glycosyltransferase family 39 protein, partial [Chloroflexota bacterium]
MRISTTSIEGAQKTTKPAGDSVAGTGRLVIAIAIIMSISSFIFFYNSHLTLAYGDAASHLNIARRVVDNISPGIAQLGGIWLPLPHILMLPLIWIDPLWRSGIAGSLVSMASYVVASWFIYSSVLNITGDRLGSFVGALAFIANPSMLYFQSTAMTEPLMIVTIVATLHFLILWAKSLEPKYLYAVGLSVFFATLSRYDGWFLVPTVLVCILVIGILRRGSMFAEGSGLAFLSIAVYGAFLWMFYNWLIFNNPLNFAIGIGSGSWYAHQYATSVEVSPKGNA